MAGFLITTPHSANPLARVCGDKLQPGVEDGETPTEVVAENQENSKKKTRKEGPEYPGEGAAKTSAAGPF